MKQRGLCPEAGCHLLERGRACAVLAAVVQGKSSMNISNPGPRVQTERTREEGKRSRRKRGKKGWLVGEGKWQGRLAGCSGGAEKEPHTPGV